MTKVVILVIIFSLTIVVTAAQPDAKLWAAICKVESGGRADAIGDSGNAVGIAQIHKGVVDDCNRVLRRKEFRYSDRLIPKKSHKMWVIYLTHYVPRGTYRQMSECWNAGPKGHSPKYWGKVRKALATSK